MPRVKQEIDKDICARLVIVMELLNIGQEETALMFNVSQSYVSRIRRGEAEMSGGMIKALFFQKNVSPMYMIAGILPVIYNKKVFKSIESDVQDLRAEVEILKAKLIMQQSKPEETVSKP